MTPEQREEGRRLLDAYQNSGAPVPSKVILSLEDWLWEHRMALLADPAIDAAEIKRQAVREFAEHLSDELLIEAREARLEGTSRGLSIAKAKIDKLAAARGVTLDEKP